MQSALPLLGRLLLAAIFIWSGYSKVIGFDRTVGIIASRHLPVPQVLAALAILAELGAGSALAVGFRTRLAAGSLFVYTAATALLFHAFWDAHADQVYAQTIQFMKNAAICGGFLYVIAYGAGAWSVDRR